MAENLKISFYVIYYDRKGILSLRERQFRADAEET